MDYNRRATDGINKSLNAAGVIIPIALLILLGFALYALIFFDARPTNHDILLVVITFLTTKTGTVVDYFYTSSASSHTKDAIINTQAQTMQAAQTTLSNVATAATATGSTDINLKPGETATATATATGTKIEKAPDVPNGFPEWLVEQQNGGRTFASTAEALNAYGKEVLGE